MLLICFSPVLVAAISLPAAGNHFIGNE
jgi:hypothetical protein